MSQRAMSSGLWALTTPSSRANWRKKYFHIQKGKLRRFCKRQMRISAMPEKEMKCGRWPRCQKRVVDQGQHLPTVFQLSRSSVDIKISFNKSSLLLLLYLSCEIRVEEFLFLPQVVQVLDKGRQLQQFSHLQFFWTENNSKLKRPARYSEDAIQFCCGSGLCKGTRGHVTRLEEASGKVKKRWKRRITNQVRAGEDSLKWGDNPAIGVQGGAVLLLDSLFRKGDFQQENWGWWQKPEMLGGKVAEMPPWWVCSVHPRWTSLNSESFSLATYPKYYYRCKNSFSTLAKDLSSWKVRWNISCCTWYLSDIFPVWVIFFPFECTSDIFPFEWYFSQCVIFSHLIDIFPII